MTRMTTLLAVLTDLVDSLERQGVRKLLLLNGHGGNELKPLMRELHHRTSVFLCLCDWFRMAPDAYQAILQVVEGARQMRHTYPAERQVKDAEIALVSGHGGNQVCHSTLILGRA